MNKFLYSIFIFSLFYSCQDHNKEKQLQQIDNLIKSTDSISKVFNKNRNDSLLIYITKVMDVEYRIRSSFNPDTVTYEFGKKINDYKQIRKKLKPIIKNNQQLKAGTIEELICLKNLKNDIKNGVGDRSKYNEYIQFEKNKINQLSLILDQIITTQHSQIETFNRLHKELYDFSQTLTPVIK